jgi:ubiquinone/menaquinone biosynthesis C-methylase UbiE
LKFPRFIIWPLLFIVLIGGISTYIHLQNKTAGLENVLEINLNLFVMIGLITAGLIIRFFKWHFFMRLYDIRLKIRKSFSIFFTSLFINLLFPLLIGEVLTKNYFLIKENYYNKYRNISLILFERVLDVLAIIILGIFFLVFSSEEAVRTSPRAYLFIGVGLCVIFAILTFITVRIKFSYKLAVSFFAGLLGWFVIYLVYFMLPAGAKSSLSFTDFSYIFSNYLVFYPTTPMGIFLSGNYLYISLEQIVKEPLALLQAVINIRIASIVPALVIGLITSVKLFKKKKSEQYHFDEISDEYTDMIPEHVRERLIQRKCSCIVEDLKQKHGKLNGLTGLDLGGGKGWYTSRLIDLTGANVILVERSTGQAEDAVRRDPRIQAVVADIEDLPFDSSFADFAFSINVFHHLEGRDAQKKAFDSVSRVLKPEGIFYLHEMNVHNIFFKIYMNYFFPLVKSIDEGIELWIDPKLEKAGNFLSNKIIYFTFLPEFAGKKMIKFLEPLEKKLENSSLKKYSAHYFRVFDNNK